MGTLFFHNFCLIFGVAHAFYSPWNHHLDIALAFHFRSQISVNLIPLDHVWSEWKNPYDEWNYYLLEEAEILDAAKLALDSFYKPRLKLNYEGMGGVELTFWKSVEGLYVSFDKGDTLLSNYLGFRTRSGLRLKQPNLDISSDSFILVGKAVGDDSIGGIVEICLEKADGNLALPIKIFKTNYSPSDEPYLCNLCIDPLYRKRGLARSLCLVAEDIVKTKWGRKTMNLHVEKTNTPALKLYVDKLSYLPNPVMSYWEAKLKGLEDIIYFSKQLV